MSFREFLGTVGRVLAYIRPYWVIVVAAITCTFLVTIAKLSQAKFIGLMFGLMADKKVALVDPKNPFAHDINGVEPFWILNYICLAFLTMMIVMGLATYLMRYWINLGGQLAIRDFRNQTFQHIQGLSMQFFDKMRLGEIHSRASGDIMTATQIYTQLADFMTNLFLVVIAMGFMLYQDFPMTALIMLVSVLIGGAVGKFGHYIGRVTERLQSRAADLAAIMLESISSIKVVKAFNREKFEMDRFAVKNQENFETQMSLVKASSSQTPVVEFLGAFGIVIMIWFGALRILQGSATFEEMTTYWTLLVMTTQPINALSGFYSSFQASAAAARRVFDILDAPQEQSGAAPLPPIVGEIQFENVHFAYEPEKPVLRGVDLTVKPGEILAIVGANGAGKTTLVNLVSRFYAPTKGRVKIDGHDLSGVKLSSLREQIGVVIQESVLFSGSIKDNIACGKADATFDEILAASKLANAHEFVDRMPEGYDTQIGERGMRLSGGQRQRIAIARALLRNPRILILDEFTSGIDAESENFITDAIEKSMKGRTCLVIAHRLNTIRHADRIIALDHGRIAEMGKHQELLAKGGLYAKIYEAQLKPNGAVQVLVG